MCLLDKTTVGSPQATFIAKSEVSTRVLDTVKRFPKVDANKVNNCRDAVKNLALAFDFHSL